MAVDAGVAGAGDCSSIIYLPYLRSAHTAESNVVTTFPTGKIAGQ